MTSDPTYLPDADDRKSSAPAASRVSLYALCAICGHARHMHVAGAACQVTHVDGPPSVTDPTPADPHPQRTITRCECPAFTIAA